MGSSSGLSVAFVAVGSNIEPQRNITAALTMLKEQVRVRASSTFYRTEPLGGKHQPDFINGVWRIETALSPAQVKNEVLRPVEYQLRRVRTEDRFAPRTIDLDLALYDGLVTDSGDVVLPHPDVRRPFVCIPILELLEGAGGDVNPNLLVVMKALLPADQPQAVPGEPLVDFTGELRRLLS